jgi:hypothetical protein
MALAVSDARSNPNDQIAHAAKALGRSEIRLNVFKAIYHGRKVAKTIDELAKATGLSNWQVLTAGHKLCGQHLVTQTKINGQTAYVKDAFYSVNKAKVLGLVSSPKRLKAFPTKYNSPARSHVVIKIKNARPKVRQITCDDIDEFSKVRRIKAVQMPPISEQAFKNGVKGLFNETGQFRDWGGERNDLHTSKARIKGKRHTLAFAFKGPGTRGVLTPRKLGKNGDQIQRLFQTVGDIFIVQYWAQIDQSVIEQMETFAKVKSLHDAKPIWFGIIDGDDTSRLMAAYPKQFGKRK